MTGRRPPTGMPERPFVPLWPLAVLAALVAAGLTAQWSGLIDARALLDWARGYAAHWWVAPALVLLQVVLYMFALPGSAVLWLVAPLFAPAASMLILTTGGCAGALAAYAFARRLTGASLTRLRASRGYRLLQREGRFLPLCALRFAPGFPHSVINYAAGTLRLPLGAFLASAAVGFALKSWLYSSAVDAALTAGRPADLLAARTWAPLLAVAVLTLAAGAWMRRR